MAIGSGLGASVGIAAETTYGTYAPPTRFHEVNSTNLAKQKNTVQGGGLAAGRFSKLASRRILATESGSAAPPMEVANKGMGLLLNHIFGAVTINGSGTTPPAFAQVHTFADNVGKMLSYQEAIPDTTGVLRPYTGKGGKVTQAEFSCDTSGMLMITPTLDFQKVSEVESLVAPSFVTGVMPFHFGQMNVRVGTFGAEVTVPGVKSFTATVARPQDGARFYAGAAGLKAEPLMNDFVAVTGSLTADFVDKTVFADRFASDAPTSVVIEFTGPLIATGVSYAFSLRFPAAFFDGDTPVVDGPGIVSGAFPFTAQFDGTNPVVSCGYVSTDAAI